MMGPIAKDPHNINVCLYGDRIVSSDWTHDLAKLAQSLVTRLALSNTHVEGLYFADGQADLVGKTYKCIGRNRGRIADLLNRPEVHLLGYCSVAADRYDVRDWRFAIYFTRRHPSPDCRAPYNRVFIQMAPDVLASTLSDQKDTVPFFVGLVREIGTIVNLRYGLVHPMSAAKLGAMYFADIFSEHLTKEERDAIHLWLRANQDYEHRVRGVYWANLLTCDHLGNREGRLLSRIRRIVGKENVVEVCKGKYFIAMPVNPLESPTRNQGLYASLHSVEAVLRRAGRLMQ